MRTLTLLLLACSSVFADATSKNAKIDELLKAIHAETLQDQIYTQLNGQIERAAEGLAQQAGIPAAEQLSATTDLREKMTAAMKSYMNWEKLKPGIVKAYNDAYSEADIDGILAFFRTPAGKAYIANSPAIAAHSREIAQNQVKELANVFQTLGKEWMDAHAKTAAPAAK